ncbi:30s ribosomal protein s1 [Holotrichia oblita]|uniref:30s ribosomal protein s1 n=1 Tax=Holotrichia oblita TaxID=644536 RepID=A0ACB9T2H5_HOLOL|nr:30s ribosomal protein s1 [Holotrichia oblita]
MESNSDDSDYKPPSKKIKNVKIEIENVRKPKNESKSKRNMKHENEEQTDTKKFKMDNHVPSKSDACNSSDSYWQNYELLSEYQNIDLNVSQNIIKLFDDGCTIPFIARYRKDATDNMSPEILREIKQNYDKINILKSRAQTVLNCIEKSGKLDENIRKSVLCARTIEEVEHIYAPFKPGNKKTLAERARSLGLQEPAQQILESNFKVNLHRYIDTNNAELDTYEKIEKGVVHIIAHMLSTDIKVLTFFRKLKTQGNFGIEVKKLKKRSSKVNDTSANQVDESKYENYFDFKMPVQFIKPHQVLAINRGETQKILSVKIIVPDFVLRRFTGFCQEKFMYYNSDNARKKILDESINDSYTRLMQPLLVREIRAELKQSAEQASYNVFCSNLKQLLLTPPIKGRAIFGIDPGFSNGCKAALISPVGTYLTSMVFYLNENKKEKGARALKEILQEYNCTLIALGNGTACRETESWISDLISRNYFHPLDVSYVIVSENGASIYSCSSEAKKEFDTLDPNIISAVSLARRIQEPLAEFVKVEPKHLGVGMYQHDLPKKKLEEALDEVVSECVSFVGVDLNTASQCLLRRIAGLSDKRATKIIEHRNKNGPYLNRKELMKISGIGSKIFEQCAGFLRVGPITAEEEVKFYEDRNSNKLDCTIIHPESYELTSKLTKHLGLNLTNVGTTEFINAMKTKTIKVDIKEMSQKFNSSEHTLKLIFDALTKPLNYDLRNDCSKVPLFKKGMTNLSDLRSGDTLTGRVTNNTHFGSFIDIGVGCNGLIHISKMKGQTLETGNTVEVRVLNIEAGRKRIGLELIQVM